MAALTQAQIDQYLANRVDNPQLAGEAYAHCNHGQRIQLENAVIAQAIQKALNP